MYVICAGRLSYLSHVVTAPHHDRQAKPNTRRCIPVHYPPVSHTTSLLAQATADVLKDAASQYFICEQPDRVQCVLPQEIDI